MKTFHLAQVLLHRTCRLAADDLCASWGGHGPERKLCEKVASVKEVLHARGVNLRLLARVRKCAPGWVNPLTRVM